MDAEGNTSGNRTGKIVDAENGALSFTYGSASETYAYFDSESGILIYNYSAVITCMKADIYFMVRVEDGETVKFYERQRHVCLEFRSDQTGQSYGR